jgi:hypothetical protein
MDGRGEGVEPGSSLARPESGLLEGARTRSGDRPVAAPAPNEGKDPMEVDVHCASSSSASDRRGADRRGQATPMFSAFTVFRGRRAWDRRAPDAPNQYVDRYPGRLAAALVAIGVLCALDAVFTLLYLQKGGAEANPLMAALIDGAGPRQFLVLKCAVTNLGLIVLCLHKNFRFVKPVIVALLAIYSALFAYHIYLAATFS